MRLSRIQYVNFTRDPESAFRQCIHRLTGTRLAPAPPTPAAQPPAPQAPAVVLPEITWDPEANPLHRLPNGNELFYVEASMLVAVSVTTRPSFSISSVTRLFEHPRLGSHAFSVYDVSADGQRFVLAEPVDGEPAELSIRVVQNWFEEFRERQK